jgi:hypothetical protein
MKIVDSYGWIEYFADGPLADKYAPCVEGANDNSTIAPIIVIYCWTIRFLRDTDH